MLFAVKTTIRKMMMIKLENYDCTYHTNSGGLVHFFSVKETNQRKHALAICFTLHLQCIKRAQCYRAALFPFSA